MVLATFGATSIMRDTGKSEIYTHKNQVWDDRKSQKHKMCRVLQVYYYINMYDGNVL